MPFVGRIILDHGTKSPIVTRLSLQIVQILDHCNIKDDQRAKIEEIYIHKLDPQLLTCRQISEDYKAVFNEQIQSYQLSPQILPFIPQLSQKICDPFLYGCKNFMRDLLIIFNSLYGTDFKEASEFYLSKKPLKPSVIQYAENNFGINHPKTIFLKIRESNLKRLTSMRNAIEHPEGYSGSLKINNFELCANGTIEEPCWWLEKDGNNLTDKSYMLHDFEVAIHDLLTLAESIFISWAEENLKIPNLMKIICTPKEQRDQNCPIKYKVGFEVS